MRPISRAKAHTPHGKAARAVNRPWLESAETSEITNGENRAESDGASRRLDTELVRRGIASTRNKAQRLIESGAVSIGGHLETKPSRKVGADAGIDVMPQGHQYVSRGAYKLLGALEKFISQGLASPQGRDCLDIGASTGGFTQVLLEHGANRVIALDVGHDQLSDSVRANPSVLEMSGTNIRDVTVESLPFRPTYVVSDVSFISLTYVIPVIARLAAPYAEIVLLVKPQFEVGKGNLGKDGIVTDPQLRAKSLEKVVECARTNGLKVMGSAPSPIEGTHGNSEYLLWLRAQ
jgi:23S rRNA (cytidine1920-2'-O)/16S rRNA (cytidine1409-2'-O)-methyltransferase